MTAAERAALLSLALLALAGCSAEAPRRPDIVLISIDTLRADELGCAGYELPTTPFLDRFRDQSVMFEDVSAAAPSTLASHASIFTAQIPQHHGASFARRLALPDSAETLAEVLRRHGYQTLAFTAHGQMATGFGLEQGFEVYRARSERREAWALRRTLRRALRRVDRVADGRPLFLFLHTYEIHHPYTPDPEILARLDPDYGGTLGDSIPVETLISINAGSLAIDEADARHLRRAYDAELVAVDEALGGLFDELRRRGRFRDAVIAVTSDHGEEFGEHGYQGWHSHTLHEELLRVPWLLHLPGGEAAGARVSDPVRLIDVAPTLLDAVGIDPPATFDGRSVLPLARGEPLRELPSVAVLDLEGADPAVWASVRYRGWKQIGPQLFDLAADPGERVDVAAIRPQRMAELNRLLRAVAGARARSRGARSQLDAETERELRALGYLNRRGGRGRPARGRPATSSENDATARFRSTPRVAASSD
ncbi:MAG TPA: sulfatase, partial [Thermoanaerobaculia bacterium]|nr:sulfatase [Thermoanaerobaculia bacterium]